MDQDEKFICRPCFYGNHPRCESSRCECDHARFI